MRQWCWRYIAALVDHSANLAFGETAIVLFVAENQKQAASYEREPLEDWVSSSSDNANCDSHGHPKRRFNVIADHLRISQISVEGHGRSA